MRDFPDAECHLVVSSDNEAVVDYLKTRFASVSVTSNFEKLPYGISEFDLVCHEWDGSATNGLIDELMRVTKSNSHIELIRQIFESDPTESSMFYLEDEDEAESTTEAVDRLRLYSKAILNVVTRRASAHGNSKAEYESIHFQVDKNLNNPDLFDY
ncbi:hypothetical protein HDU84_009213 [Entophlyctis sp. JEL0112]|nr:hypothetical protein HDU84_009213 [Entophlyctis sp. JEL0112]